MSMWRAEEWGHLKCHGQGQDRKSDFPSGQKSPSLSPAPHRGKVNWNRERVKESVNLLRTNSTNLVL